MEFIHTARELQIHSIRKAAGFPKRYTFYVSQHIVDAATNVHKWAKMGNSIYPTNQHEVQVRRDYMMRALAELQALVSQIEVAAELFPIDGKQMRYWMDLVNKEDRLLRAVLKSDKARYQNLPA